MSSAMPTTKQCDMSQGDISRYSRQLIMPEIGASGQQRLQQSSVLIIGAGGLGCPALQYLVGAGVGTIGILDYDEVERSNLHRQVLHTEAGARTGMSKAESAAQFAQHLNSDIKVRAIVDDFNAKNAAGYVRPYDVVIDASDNAATRYLINDVCVLLDKPLVSGSALGWDGQLTVYHYKPSSDSEELGLCYRCLFPTPPPPETVTNCSSGGVLGPVPGIIGTMQALETIKILVGICPSVHQKMLVFDSRAFRFTMMRLRRRQKDCVVCGDDPSITDAEQLPDYEEFCGAGAHDKCKPVFLLDKRDRITAVQYKEIYTGTNHILIDVRQPVELEICSFPHAINIPIKKFDVLKSQYSSKNRGKLHPQVLPELYERLCAESWIREGNTVNIIVICKQGNDSQKAAHALINLIDFDFDVRVVDVTGGCYSWSRYVDEDFPVY